MLGSKSCLTCVYSIPDPNTPIELRMQGKMQSRCLRMPPAVVGAITAQGIATVQLYPTVTADTMSCGEYTHTTPADMKHGD